MSADATQILDAVSAALTSLYPDIPVKVRRLDAPHDPPTPGFAPGDPSTCFIVSGSEREDVDEYGTFEDVSVGYAVCVDYVRPSPPGSYADEDDIRQKRQAIRRELYKPAIGALAAVVDVKNKAKEVYESAGGGKFVGSGQVFVFVLQEPRPEL